MLLPGVVAVLPRRNGIARQAGRLGREPAWLSGWQAAGWLALGVGGRPGSWSGHLS